MTDSHDLERRIADYYATEAPSRAPDWVLGIALETVNTVAQRRALVGVPWRLPAMNTYARLAIVATAVVIVAIIGYSLLPGRNGGGVGAPTASPSPSPTPPIPSASPTAAAFPPSGNLAVGERNAIELEGIPFTFTVPTSDWVSNGSFAIDKRAGIGPEGAGFILWTDTPVGVFADPCAQEAGPEIGTSIADLAAAVAAMPGVDVVSGPTEVTVGGYPAQHVVVTIREDIGCDAQSFYLWYAPTPDFARFATAVGSTIRTWIIDVGGTSVWIDAETYAGAGPGPAQEIQAIIDSIEFEP